MPDANRQTSPHTSVVGECSATDCRHNEHRDCHAGQIVVQIGQGTAMCGTYDPETPKARP
jgi:hypothetical protein